MFVEPTINDFIFKIRWHLPERLRNAGSKVAEAHGNAAQRGIGLSSTTWTTIFLEVRKEFEGGIETVLGELKRAIRTTKFDPNDLKQAAVGRLADFAHMCRL
jgi:hypothetical protein